MGNPILARYSIRSKQDYIFKTNRLVEIVGASMIIADAFNVLFQCAEKCRCPYQRDETPVKFDLADVLRRFEEKSLDMLELYTGGGNCTVLYRDMDVCRKVNMSYTRLILKEFPGLLPMCVRVEIEPDEIGRYNYQADMDKLKRAEETEKNRMFPGRGRYALPFAKMDRVTFQPLSKFDYPGGQRTEFSEESFSKRKYESAHNQSPEGRSLDDIGGLLAIVHADGNNMGLKIDKRLRGQTDYTVCVNAMRDFTREIRAVYRAGRAALEAIPVAYPIRWLVSEGDDATFICNAKCAKALTEAYLRGVRDYRAASGEIYSACAESACFTRIIPAPAPITSRNRPAKTPKSLCISVLRPKTAGWTSTSSKAG